MSDTLLEQRYATLYDTAKRNLIIIDVVYPDFVRLLNNISDESFVQNNNSTIPQLYLNAYSFIDFTHRFVQIIDSMPFLSKKQNEVRKLHTVTNQLKKARNYIQHIREHLIIIENINFPILGSISWIIGNKNFTILPSQTTNYSVLNIPFDNKTNKFVCSYMFFIETFQIPIDIIYNELKTFWKWLDNISKLTPSSLHSYEWGSYPIVMSEFIEP